MSIAVAQSVVVVPTLATFNSSPVATFVPGGAQLAYLQGEVTELDGGQAFYQARDNDFSTATSFPDIIADSTGLRWSVTTSVTQAQIVSALTSAGTLPGLDPLTAQGANIASATTTDLSTATGNYINITGTTTITGLGTIAAGKLRFVTFTGILTLTNNATSLILPGGANITTAAGDSAIFVSLGSGNWKCIVYTEAAGGTPGTLGVPQGGTGVTTIAANGIPYGAGASPIGVTAQGAAGTVLHGNGASAPSFSAVSLTVDVTGTLPATNGGTGHAVYAVGDLLYASTTTALSRLADVATGSVVVSGGIGVAPAYSSSPTLATLSLAQGTITDPALALAITSTWNDAADTFDAFDINVTNTNSAAASRLINLRVGGSSQFAVTRAGIGTFAGQVVAASFSPSTTAGIIGTTTNDNAAAGSVGEIVESTVLVGSAVSLTTGVYADITSIPLTAGDWDVWASVNFVPNGATTMAGLNGWVNTTSATEPTAPNGGAFFSHNWVFQTGGAQRFPVGMRRYSVAGATTVYLSTIATFAVNTLGAYGYIGARRVR